MKAATLDLFSKLTAKSQIIAFCLMWNKHSTECFLVNTLPCASQQSIDQFTLHCLVKFTILRAGGIYPKTPQHCQ